MRGRRCFSRPIFGKYFAGKPVNQADGVQPCNDRQKPPGMGIRVSQGPGCITVILYDTPGLHKWVNKGRWFVPRQLYPFGHSENSSYNNIDEIFKALEWVLHPRNGILFLRTSSYKLLFREIILRAARALATRPRHSTLRAGGCRKFICSR